MSAVAGESVTVKIDAAIINVLLGALQAGLRAAAALQPVPNAAQLVGAQLFEVGLGIGKLGLPLDLDGAVSDELQALAAGYCEGAGIAMHDAGEVE